MSITLFGLGTSCARDDAADISVYIRDLCSIDEMCLPSAKSSMPSFVVIFGDPKASDDLLAGSLIGAIARISI